MKTWGKWIAGSFAGRLLAGAVIVKFVASTAALFVGRTPWLEALDTVGDVSLIAAAAVLVSWLVAHARRRFLWRVRRKLILSYVFIGVVPVLLLITFFVVCGLLLFFNVGSYMMRSQLEGLLQEARLLADSTALELTRAQSADDIAAIVARHQAAFAARYPVASFAIVPAANACPDGRTSPVASAVAGPWVHSRPPSMVPAWIQCSAYSDLMLTLDGGTSNLWARAVAWPDGAPYAVVVDVPVTAAIADGIELQTGVRLKNFGRFTDDGEGDARAEMPSDVKPRVTLGPAQIRVGVDAPQQLGDRFEWISVFDVRNWDSGKTDTLTILFTMSPMAMYGRISAASVARVMSGLSFGQVLLLLLAVIGALFLIIQTIAFAMGLALARSITGAIHELFAGTERVRRGDFTQKIAIRSNDQLGELAGSFNSMTSSIEDLLLQKAEKERLEQELRIARSIQMSLLPAGPLEIPGLTLIAHCEPAREVGGDYYDFVRIDDTTVGILIADVAGKGTSAALYMAELKGIVLSLCTLHRSPRQLLLDANRIVSRHLDTRSFITITYGVLDLATRTLRYARAGHCPAIYVPGPYAPSREPQILAPDGLVLGLNIDEGGAMFTRLLEEATLQLGAGDLFVLYTDGVTEAMNASEEFFGESRLVELVRRHGDAPAEELRERILRDVRAFAGSEAHHDDMTMVILKVNERDDV